MNGDLIPNPKQFFGPLLGIKDKKHINVIDETPYEYVWIPEVKGWFARPF
jgi:hypothetical protein